MSPAHAENVPVENRDLYADIAEIFSSIQGEGLYVGRRQIFIRFCGCNLNCRYCDTETSASDVGFGVAAFPVCR